MRARPLFCTAAAQLRRRSGRPAAVSGRTPRGLNGVRQILQCLETRFDERNSSRRLFSFEFYFIPLLMREFIFSLVFRLYRSVDACAPKQKNDACSFPKYAILNFAVLRARFSEGKRASGEAVPSRAIESGRPAMYPAFSA